MADVSGAGRSRRSRLLDSPEQEYKTSPSRAFESQEGHEACVRLLVEHGADVDKAVDEGATQLWIAPTTY